MALAPRPKDIPLKELDDRILIFNGLTQAENIGTITRTASAFGINSMIVDEKSVSVYLKRSIRVSMGNVFFQKIHHCQKLTHTLKELKKMGYQIIGSAAESTTLLEKLNPPKKVALIIGSEGHGMSHEIRELCDLTLSIPIEKNVAHLNASAAAAILCYHLRG